MISQVPAPALQPDALYLFAGKTDHTTPARRSCAPCSWISRTIPTVANLGDEYMFGPAFLVAPVTEQGRESRQVYLPAGRDWYNYWTNEQFKGGQTVQVAAPIDVIPLFVRRRLDHSARSRHPEHLDTHRHCAKFVSIPARRRNSCCTTMTACQMTMKKGKSTSTTLRWDEKAQVLGTLGDKLSGPAIRDLVRVVSENHESK